MKDNLMVVCGIANHSIFVTEVNNPTYVSSPVKTNAISAVRDYMVDEIPAGKNSTGYSWKRSDGKIIKLICMVDDT